MSTIREDEHGAAAERQGEEQLGRGMRRKVLTLKARENKVMDLEELFWTRHDRYVKLLQESEELVKAHANLQVLQDQDDILKAQYEQLYGVFEELRQIPLHTMDRDIRLAIDRCSEDKRLIRDRIGRKINDITRNADDERDDHYVPLQHQSTVESDNDRRSHRSSKHSGRGSSRRSSRTTSTTSLEREARAKAAAHRAELEAADVTAFHQEQLQRMEIEERKRRAEAELELEKKKRDLERVRIEKLLAIEEAKLQAYEESRRGSQASERLFSTRRSETNRWTVPNRIGTTVPKTSTPKVESDADKSQMVILAEAISSSMKMSHIPVPEPPIFTGDPLQYADWNAAFKALIDNKAIDERDKLFHLKKYVSGEAKEAISGLFILQSPDAYKEARSILDARYGNKYIITEAFREKLDNWPTIKTGDPKALRRLSDFLQQCDSAMKEIHGLSILNDYREMRKVLEKLPEGLVNRWGRKVNETKAEGNYPSFASFAKFVKKESEIANDPLTSTSKLKKLPEKKEKDKREITNARTLVTESTDSKKTEEKPTCEFCKRLGHKLEDCFSFLKKSLEDRIQFVQKNSMCFGCLQQGHPARWCRNRLTCKTCGKKHPTPLHRDREEKASGEESASKETSVKDEGLCNRTSHGKSKGKLSAMIVPVWVSSKENPGETLVYALLDTQSDTTFVTNDVLDQLGGTGGQPVMLKLATMAAKQTVVQCQKISSLQVRGFYSDKFIELPTTYSRDFIPADRSHIPTRETANQWEHLKPIKNHIPPLQDCQVGLLIGYNCPAALAPKTSLINNETEPYAVETGLGWSIVGVVKDEEEISDSIGYSHRIVVKTIPEDLQSGEKDHVSFKISTKFKEQLSPSDITRLLEADFRDEATDSTMLSQHDIKFLKIMKENIRQNETGNYEMPLPFKEASPDLPDNREAVLRRFKGCQMKRFKRDEKYLEDYTKFMKEIISRGDVERVPAEEVQKKGWYIPHHGVYHPKKPGKIRVVFDCSAKYQGVSLNDCLMQGPDMTNGLVGVLLRFRKEKIAFMCDIEKMFHQFKVTEADRNYLRFLWFDEDNKIVDYRMKVHLFGATSSPSCANYGLKQCAKDHANEKHDAKNFITRGFYVDDGLKSVATVEEGQLLIKDAVEVCSKGNLRLHKFVASDAQVLDCLPASERADIKDKDLQLEVVPIERALGVQWCVESDCFRFCLAPKDQPLTRRSVLSTVASVYDPFGFLAPFVLKGKQILQTLCKENVGWDDPLPDEICIRWKKWQEDVPKLQDVQVARCVKPSDFTSTKYELHHFSDASTEGYGQCSYLRCTDDIGNVHCCLVMGKSRVAPLKVTTIPRLELQAAVVSAKMGVFLENELQMKISHYYYCDSKVVLGYIGNDAKRFHVYVANRVQTIQDLSAKEDWRYVESEDNPADHASRGLTASGLIASSWFTGPAFLWEKEIECIEVTQYEVNEEDVEVRNTHALKTHTVGEHSTHPMLTRAVKFSDWRRLIVGFTCLRRRITKGPQHDEEVQTEKILLKVVQDEAYGDTMNQRKDLQKLDPFVDEDGLLRVGGRMKHSSESPQVKHPVILPRDCHITRLLVRHYHEKVHHQGRGITMNALRAHGYWIVGASRCVSSLIHQCVTCRKLRGKLQEQKMADLPKERVEESPPFTHCGMDCFGPFSVKDGRRYMKKYGLLFTCMASRAVHVEMLDDMSTDAFINGLRCLIAIRGPIKYLYCDNGTNFVGAQHEFEKALKELEKPVREFLKKNGCTFKFNVPSASHMGGVWERQIRSVRSILSAMMLQHSERLDSATLRTFFYEAMAIVNSRPLTVESLQDPSGPLPLTPNHLLTMKSEVIASVPGVFAKEDVYGRKRWKKVQYLANEFWSRWKKEYLNNIQKRQKWTKTKRNVQVGDVVILKEDDLTRTWRLGRVEKTTTDRDGLVRTVRLKIGETHLDRPIHKLVLLVENQD